MTLQLRSAAARCAATPRGRFTCDAIPSPLLKARDVIKDHMAQLTICEHARAPSRCACTFRVNLLFCCRAGVDEHLNNAAGWWCPFVLLRVTAERPRCQGELLCFFELSLF